MPVADAEPVLTFFTTIVPLLVIELDAPDTEIPLVFDVIEPLFVVVVGVDPVIVRAVLDPPAIVPSLMIVSVGVGDVGLAMTTGPTVDPCGL
jgi:hypothetical protein